MSSKNALFKKLSVSWSAQRFPERNHVIQDFDDLRKLESPNAPH